MGFLNIMNVLGDKIFNSVCDLDRYFAFTLKILQYARLNILWLSCLHNSQGGLWQSMFF